MQEPFLHVNILFTHILFTPTNVREIQKQCLQKNSLLKKVQWLTCLIKEFKYIIKYNEIIAWAQTYWQGR